MVNVKKIEVIIDLQGAKATTNILGLNISKLTENHLITKKTRNV